MSIKECFDILGVEFSATDKEIRKAYSDLAKKYHPDTLGNSASEEKFKEINEAYHILKKRSKSNINDLNNSKASYTDYNSNDSKDAFNRDESIFFINMQVDFYLKQFRAYYKLYDLIKKELENKKNSKIKIKKYTELIKFLQKILFEFEDLFSTCNNIEKKKNYEIKIAEEKVSEFNFNDYNKDLYNLIFKQFSNIMGDYLLNIESNRNFISKINSLNLKNAIELFNLYQEILGRYEIIEKTIYKEILKHIGKDDKEEFKRYRNIIIGAINSSNSEYSDYTDCVGQLINVIKDFNLDNYRSVLFKLNLKQSIKIALSKIDEVDYYHKINKK